MICAAFGWRWATPIQRNIQLKMMKRTTINEKRLEFMRIRMIEVTLCIAAFAVGATAQTVTGSGSSGAVPVFTGTSTVGNSPISVSGGNVGIGTTVPWEMLSLGDGAGATLGLAGISGTSYNFDFTTMTGNYLQVESESPSALPVVITGNGNVGVGTVAPGYRVDVNTPVPSGVDTYSGLQLRGDTYGYLIEGGIKQSAGAILKFSANNNGSISEKMRIDNVGNVGIGTTAPGAKLEVDGSVKLTSGSGASLTFADGTVQSTAYTGVTCGGDYAESVDVDGIRANYEPGDVLVIGPASGSDVIKSSEPYSTVVAGVYSTKPGVVGRRQTTDSKASKTEVPMAMIGIAPPR